MSLDHLLRGHLRSSRGPAKTPGVTTRPSRNGTVYRVGSFLPDESPSTDPTASLEAELKAQQAARRDR